MHVQGILHTFWNVSKYNHVRNYEFPNDGMSCAKSGE